VIFRPPSDMEGFPSGQCVTASRTVVEPCLGITPSGPDDRTDPESRGYAPRNRVGPSFTIPIPTPENVRVARNGPARRVQKFRNTDGPSLSFTAAYPGTMSWSRLTGEGVSSTAGRRFPLC
jgi:hypothetical protein